MAIAQDNSLGNLGNILSSIPGLSEAINGGKSTTTSSISSQGMSALLQQILSGTNGLASVAGGQNTAGLYNSTVQTQMVNDLLSRSAGEVASKDTTSTTTKAPTLNLGDTILQGAAGLIGTKLLGKGVDALGSTVADALGLGTTSAGGQAAGGSLLASTTGTNAAFTAGGSVPTAVANASLAGASASEAGAAGATGAAAAGADAAGSVGAGIGATGAGAIGAGTAAGLGLSTAGAIGASTAGGLAAGGATLGGLGGAIAGDVAASTAGIAAGAGVGAGAAAGGAAAGGAASTGIGEALAAAVAAWVICTELQVQGEMSYETYQKAAPNFVSKMRLKPSAVRGYHYWAVRYTKLMRRSDWIGKLATAAIKPLATGRADYINGKWNLRGWVTFNILEPVCSVLGKTVARKPQNWKQLYSETKEK